MAQVTLKNIVKYYGANHPVIQGIDLDIRDGEFVVFVGPSGCGKSTLLRMIAGLEDITGGELCIGNKIANNVPPAARGLAMVFQSYALYPHMSVYENMAFALKLAGQKRAEVDAAVQHAAEILQIGGLLKRKPKELSGGQRQRVAIGRAIVRKPELFLFDEPLSNLDASLRVQMRVEISRLQKELKTTMIYVTHDQIEAMTLGERIVVLNGGRIEQVGTPLDLYNTPGNLFVAGFLGSPKMNMIPGEVTTASAREVAVNLPGGSTVKVVMDGTAAQPGASVTLGVRAEYLAFVDDLRANSNSVGVTIRHVEHLGDVNIVYVEMDGVPELLAVKQPMGVVTHQAGDTAVICLPPDQCHLFDAAGKAFKMLCPSE